MCLIGVGVRRSLQLTMLEFRIGVPYLGSCSVKDLRILYSELSISISIPYWTLWKLKCRAQRQDGCCFSRADGMEEALCDLAVGSFALSKPSGDTTKHQSTKPGQPDDSGTGKKPFPANGGPLLQRFLSASHLPAELLHALRGRREPGFLAEEEAFHRGANSAKNSPWALNPSREFQLLACWLQGPGPASAQGS